MLDKRIGRDQTAKKLSWLSLLYSHNNLEQINSTCSYEHILPGTGNIQREADQAMPRTHATLWHKYVDGNAKTRSLPDLAGQNPEHAVGEVRLSLDGWP